MEKQEPLKLFEHLLLCCHPLHFWTFSARMELLYSSSLHTDTVLRILSGPEKNSFLSYAQSAKTPALISTEAGLTWIVEPEHAEDALTKIHAVGPFYLGDLPDRDAAQLLLRRGFSQPEAAQGMTLLRQLPVIPLGRAFEYAIMLHYCVTGNTITASDLAYQAPESKRSRKKGKHQTVDVHGTYAMEKEMLRMVREGNPDILTVVNRLAVSGNLGKLSAGDPSRQMKNAVLVNIVLFSRAAIDGGLSPELSMTMTDHYFQSVEACRTLPELREIAETMQLDFVRRVHRIRSEGYSKPVAAAAEWIRAHLEEDLTLRDLAAQLNYSEYYLSRRFKQETGVNIKAFIGSERLNRAKSMLLDSDISVHEISTRLRFCSQSYFADQFKKAFGVTPLQYRTAGTRG